MQPISSTPSRTAIFLLRVVPLIALATILPGADALEAANNALNEKNEQIKSIITWVCGAALALGVLGIVWGVAAEKNMKIIVPGVVGLLVGGIGLAIAPTFIGGN